jgi:hypothetical protein
MSQNFQEAYRGVEDALDSIIGAATGVPAHILADCFQRRANQQRKLAEASAQEAAGQPIAKDGVNQSEGAARSSPTDAAPIIQDGRVQPAQDAPAPGKPADAPQVTGKRS